MDFIKISASVGKGGKNFAKDVNVIQALYNAYARANKKSTFSVDGKYTKELGTAIGSFQKDVLNSSSPDSRIDTSGKTFKRMKKILDEVFKPVAVKSPTYGVVTWEAEGTEGGRYHSRKFHVPSSVSGLTIGRGYDMKTKSASTISVDLIGAGIKAKEVAAIKLAAGLSGNAARQFIIDNDLLDFQVTPEAQKKLFKVSYDAESDQVKRICKKSDVVIAYGKTDWDKLNSAIKDITIDLKFRGDYTGTSRKIIQKSIADNNLSAFKKHLKDKKNWKNVPKDRFDRRNTFLDGVK